MIVPHADLKFAHQTLNSFLECVALSRVVQELQHPPATLRIGGNAAFDTAVISWCVLFGSDHIDHQRLHWKNMFEPNAFRDGLLASLGMPLDDWRAYRKTVVDYRNDLSAHRSLNPKPEFHPNFDHGIAAADFYYECLRQRFVAEMGRPVAGGPFTEEFDKRLASLREEAVLLINGLSEA